MDDLLDVISKTLWAEARGESFEGIKAVASVIMNRAKNNTNNIRTVILKPKQFSCWNNGSPVVQTKNSADIDIWMSILFLSESMINGSFKITGDWTHYYNPKLCNPSWAKGIPYVDIGNHRFLKVK